MSCALRPASFCRLAISVLRLACLLFVPFWIGCNNPGSQLTPEEIEKRRKEQQSSLKANDLVSLPTDVQKAIVTIKPGHWVETAQRFKSTKEDLQVLAVGSIYRGNESVVLPLTNFVNQFTRRSNLPKGQEKSLSLRLFVPPRPFVKQPAPISDVSESQGLAIGTELLTLPMMSPILESGQRSAVNELRDHEFQLVVLSPQALAYQHLAGMDAINWFASDAAVFNERIRSYDVSLVQPVDNETAFPRSLLTMTSIAVIVWDDLAGSDLSQDQQSAILDWLHWGGQLIISGPTSWSRLQNSFLLPHLPVHVAESTELNTQAFAELSSHWITRDLGKRDLKEPIQIDGLPLTGLKLHLSEQGSWLPGTNQLVAESRVGRGRIVVTAFPMRDPRIYEWPYYSSFFSTGLLRRWPRELRNTSVGSFVHTWCNPFSSDDFDPRMHSNIRILARDISGSRSPSLPSTAPSKASIGNGTRISNDESKQKATFEPYQWSGAGSWSDTLGMSPDAIQALRAAAGIKLPSRSTILKLLGGYLLCLVPLNYLVFRLFRRLEFAWLAAPILSLGAVVVVTKVAQLDIGFARRTIDIGVLELYDNHPRAHLTQFTALYTSLSTNYSIEFPETDSAALPMGDPQRESRRLLSSTRQLQTHYGRTEGVLLEPLTVYSNSTEMLRAEQMVELGSPVIWTGGNGTSGGLLEQVAIQNTADFAIESAIVVRRGEDQKLQSTWLGDIAAGQRQAIQWKSNNLEDTMDRWNREIGTQASPPDAAVLNRMQDIWVGGLLHRIVENIPIESGNAVLIGLSNVSLDGIKIHPTQEQWDRAQIVVVHLTSRREFGPVQPDLAIMSRSPSEEEGDSK